MNINLFVAEIQKRIHKVNVANGWYEKEVPIPEALMLINTEIAEAREDLFKEGFLSRVNDSGKPIGFSSEISDIVIRTLDYATRYEVVLDPNENDLLYQGFYPYPIYNTDYLLSSIQIETCRAMEAFREGLTPKEFSKNFVNIIALCIDISDLIGFDLEKEIEQKVAYNATRGYRHGGKKA